jgi:Putative bacterial sensory transduction regulator
MSETVVDYTPAERVTEDDMSWEQFGGRLAAVLGRMAAGSYLILSSRADDEIVYYVQFAQGGRGGFRAEAESNNFLAGRWALSPAQEEQLAGLGWQCPMPGDSDLNFMRQWPTPAPYAEIASLALRSLREVYGIERPSELVYRRFAKGGRDFAEPELGIAAERATTPTGRVQGAAPRLAELIPLVERAVKGFLGTDEIVRDKDGDIPIRQGSALLFVRTIDGVPPVVRVFSLVLHSVESSPPLLEALNEINAKIMFGRVMWGSDRVMVSAEVPAIGISAEQIAFVCLQIGALADHLDDELGDRFGGRKRFDEPAKLVN